MEGISVTTDGEQLILTNLNAVRNNFLGILPLLAVFLLVWLSNLDSWVNRHHLAGPLNSLWNNPAFQSEMFSETVTKLFPALALIIAVWYQSRGSGRTVIHRATKTMTVGRNTTPIRSVVISSMRGFFNRKSYIFPTQHARINMSFGGVMLPFRQKENAERVTRFIAEFLDVPLRDFSSGKRGEEDHAAL